MPAIDPAERAELLKHLSGYLSSIELLEAVRKRREDSDPGLAFLAKLGHDLRKSQTGILEHGAALHRFARRANLHADTTPLTMPALNPLNDECFFTALLAMRDLGEELKANPAKSAGEGAKAPPSKGMADSKALADEWGLDSEAVRKALERWRRRHAGGDGYSEVHDRRPNEPQYLYARAKVWHVMEAAKDRDNRREILRTKTSGKRPAR